LSCFFWQGCNIYGSNLHFCFYSYYIVVVVRYLSARKD
jgi:hypothetical protein